MIRSPTERADPPLRRGQVWRVDGKGLVFSIPCRCSLQAPDIGPMAQLCLGVATNILVFLCLMKKQLMLLWCPLIT